MDKRRFEDLTYKLHFHGLSNSISANYYRELDQGLAYLSTLATTLLATVFGGTLVVSLKDDSKFPDRIKVFASLVTATSAIAIKTLSKVSSGDHAPGKKKVLHHDAAYQMRKLRKQVAYFLDVLKENEPDAGNRLKEFLSEQKNIERKCQSEKWTFPQVYNELSPRMKALGEKLGEYSPSNESQAYISMSSNWMLVCGCAVGVFGMFGLWKISSYLA